MRPFDEEEKKKRFEYIFLHYFPKVKSFAYKLLQSEEDAEDVAQDVFVKLWNYDSAVWDEVKSLDVYLYTITRNQIFNQLKHKTVENAYKEKISKGKLEMTEQEFYEPLYVKELQLIVKLALEQMPPQRRRIFMLSRYSHMSNLEIANKLELSVRTVETSYLFGTSGFKKDYFYSVFSGWIE